MGRAKVPQNYVAAARRQALDLTPRASPDWIGSCEREGEEVERPPGLRGCDKYFFSSEFIFNTLLM